MTPSFFFAVGCVVVGVFPMCFIADVVASVSYGLVNKCSPDICYR